MRKTVQIGGKAVDLLCNAVTPILYKSAYRQDVMAVLARKTTIPRTDPRKTPEELKAMSPEEKENYLKEMGAYAEELMGTLTEMQDTVGKLAHVMAMQAQAEDEGIVLLTSGITESTYMQWLAQFEQQDISDAMKDILEVYQTSARQTVTPKN